MFGALGIFQNIGLPELLIIVFILILLFGARRLPELGRSIGEGVKNFRTSMKDAARDDETDKDKPKQDSTQNKS